MKDRLADIDASTSILVLGAGFSRGAKTQSGKNVPSGDELKEDMLKHLGIAETTRYSLPVVAQRFLQDKSENSEIITYLESWFKNVTGTEHHRKIIALPWRTIFTINYDDLIENESRLSKRRFLGVSRNMSLESAYSQKRPLCIHLNGYIRDIATVPVEDAIRFTIDSYRDGNFLNSRHLSLLRSSIGTATSIIVIGSTLDGDLELAQLFPRTPSNLSEKTFFVLGVDPDPFVRASVENIGHLAEFGVAEFADLLQEARNVNVSPETDISHFSTIKQIDVRQLNDGMTPTLTDVYELLLLGHRRDDFLPSSLAGEIQYFVRRSVIEDVVSAILTGAKGYVIYSDFANGKSCFLDQVGIELSSAGRRVVKLSNLTEDSPVELTLVYESVENVVILVDSYNQWIDVLEKAGPPDRPGVQFVFTSRSVIHDLLWARLERYLGQACQSRCIDSLVDEEVASFDRLMSENGLWGSRAGMSEWERKHYIKTRCHGQINGILSVILEAPQIKSLVIEIFRPLNDMPNVKIALTKLFIVTLMEGANLGYSYIRDICGSVLDSESCRGHDSVRQLIDFRNGTVLMSSSYLAKFMVDEMYSGNQDALINICVEMFKTLSSFGERSVLKHMAIDLMKTSTLQKIFKDRGPKECVKFYEKVKGLDLTKDNHDYFLQFAIALTIDKRFPQAFHAIESAKALALKRGKSIDNIENHRARWILSHRIELADAVGAMKDFREAHGILLKQAHRPEQREHPFKVASLYEKFFFAFADRLSEGDRIEIVSAAKRILERLEAVKADSEATRSMDKCLRLLEKIVEHRKQ